MSYQKIRTNRGYKILDEDGVELSHGLSEEAADQVISELEAGDAHETDQSVTCRECMDHQKIYDPVTRGWDPCPYCG